MNPNSLLYGNIKISSVSSHTLNVILLCCASSKKSKEARNMNGQNPVNHTKNPWNKVHNDFVFQARSLREFLGAISSAMSPWNRRPF